MIRKLPTPQDIKELYPLSEKIVKIKEQRDREIADVFTGKSNKFLLIIGPCSADKEEPVLDYISRLVPVQEQVKDKILIIPRIYTNKPRTTGEGYKGIRQALPVQTKCSTPRIIVICPTFCLM